MTTFQSFDLAQLVADHEKAGLAWREFLRVPSLSMGIYQLKAGAVDKQSPHKQDEIYYLVGGRASLTVDGETHAVKTGSVVFVAAHAVHRFHDIREDMTALVFFAPAETE